MVIDRWQSIIDGAPATWYDVASNEPAQDAPRCSLLLATYVED